MHKALLLSSVLVFSQATRADDVSEAYDQALAAGKVALTMQKQCELSVQKSDLAPCKSAQKAYGLYDKKSRAFMSSVNPPDLFNHVTPAQMDEINRVAKELGASMDYVNAYLDTKR
jgi:hypothetical protein